MKATLTILFALFSVYFSFAQQSIFDIKFKTIDGEETSLNPYKGKKIIIVNTASKCGLTPQYEDLEKLYQQYKDKNLVIIGFPANNFMGQEPGNNSEIKAFCTKNYGVSFPMMEKISVKGDDMHPVYQWLTQKSKNGVSDNEVKWNFQKYLIDENGNFVKWFSPREKPNCSEIINWLEEKK